MPTYDQNKTVILPEGDYPFRVTTAKETTAQKSGKEIIELVMEVDGGAAGQTLVTDRLVFTPAAYWRIDAFRVCTGETLGPAAKVDFEAEHCIGRTGHAKFYIDEFEGQRRNKVQAYLTKAAVNNQKGQIGPKAPGIAPDNIPF